MDIERYKKIAKLLVVLMVILIIVLFFVLPAVKENKEIKEIDSDISNTGMFITSDYDNGKLVQDYLNPTEEEKAAVGARFGYGNFWFSDIGLEVYPLEDDESKVIYTDVWFDHEFLNAVQKPEMDIFLIEVSDSYLQIEVENVEEDDLKDYSKLIKDEYSNKLYSRYSETVFRAYNSKEMIVDIKFYPKTSKGIIRYEL